MKLQRIHHWVIYTDPQTEVKLKVSGQHLNLGKKIVRNKQWLSRKNVIDVIPIFELKTVMRKTNLHDYSDSYILDKGTASAANMEGARTSTSNKNNNEDDKIILKYCASCTDCISKIKNA